MTAQQLAAALVAASKIAAGITEAQPELSDLKASAEAFVAIATSALPAAPNGDTWTDDDLNALADGNHALAQEIIARHES